MTEQEIYCITCEGKHPDETLFYFEDQPLCAWHYAQQVLGMLEMVWHFLPSIEKEYLIKDMQETLQYWNPSKGADGL